MVESQEERVRQYYYKSAIGMIGIIPSYQSNISVSIIFSGFLCL